MAKYKGVEVPAPIVPEHILHQVDRHYSSHEQPYEIVGWLYADILTHEVREYEKRTNLHRKPHECFRVGQPKRLQDCYPFLLHSHPPGHIRTPSPRDMAGAHKMWLGRPYAILIDGVLRIFMLKRSDYRFLVEYEIR